MRAEFIVFWDLIGLENLQTNYYIVFTMKECVLTLWIHGPDVFQSCNAHILVCMDTIDMSGLP